LIYKRCFCYLFENERITSF